MLTQRFDDALAYASDLHRRQQRSGSQVPYVSHLLAVASLTIEHGGDEDQAIAALLHDAAEDQGGYERLADIRSRYGDRVAEIVSDCTDTFEDPKPKWLPRKQSYIESLSKKANASLLVSLADKTHNTQSILADYMAIGPAVFSRFTGGKDGTLWYYASLCEAFRELTPGPLARMLEFNVAAVLELDQTGFDLDDPPLPRTHSLSIIRNGVAEAQHLYGSTDEWALEYADVLRNLPGAKAPDDVIVVRITPAS